MKKFVVILVCTFVLTILIAFNYVLWDRENTIKDFKDIETTKNASISGLVKENMSLEESNKKLEESLDNLKKVIEKNQEENDRLIQTNNKIIHDYEGQHDLINKLAASSNLKPVEELIVKWVDFINQGKYEEAYKLQKNDSINNGNPLKLEEFIDNYKNSIKSIKLNSASFDPSINKRYGKLLYKVLVDVKKKDGSVTNIFNDGSNIKYFGISYDKAAETWRICSIDAE